MSSDILQLPAKSFNKICNFVDDKALLRMREVSKYAKDLIELSILNIRNTQVDEFWAMRGWNSNIRICILIQSVKEYSFWEMCLISVLNKLENIDCTFNKLQNVYMYISMNSKDVKSFLKFLKPLVNRAQFGSLRIQSIGPQAVQMCSNFFKGKIISKVSLRLGKPRTYFTPCIELIRTVKATDVECSLQELKTDCHSFLLKIADVVEQLRIRERNSRRSIPGTVSIVRALLSCKCVNLSFHKMISLSEIEDLINCFHHMEKKIYFSANTLANPRNGQIGEYITETFNIDQAGRMVLITHCDFNQQ